MTQIYITRFDHDRLTSLLAKKKPHDDFDKALLAELAKAEIVEPDNIPADVITMNSHIRFTDEHNNDWDYWLVFPEDIDVEHHKISVLSPIGCALLGYKVGDTVALETPLQGERELLVKEVLRQPEREGRFDA